MVIMLLPKYFWRNSLKVVDAETMRAIDEEAIKDYGLPGIALMENAGRGIAEVILKTFPNLKDKKVAILCGKGNNGGDGIVVARHLQNNDVKPSVYLFADEESIKGDAATNLNVWKEMGGVVHSILSEADLKLHNISIIHSMVLVDALFGTGLKTEVKGVYSEAISLLNRLNVPVVSVDSPSGLDCSTGKILGEAVKADITVTFGLPKIGLLIHPGAEHAGKLVTTDIGIPSSIIERTDSPYSLLDDSHIRRSLIKRNTEFHKGDGGHLFVLAGSQGKTGAASLASMAALRVGAGLVTLGIPDSLNPIMEEKLTEVMTCPLTETKEKTVNLQAFSAIKKALKGKRALALGPGISTHPEVKKLVLKLVEEVDIPIVLDADALNCVADNIEIFKNRKSPVILTPHPGEMARLTKTSSSKVQEDRLEMARSFAVKHSVTLILKGSRTLIADPKGHIYVNPTGNPGMASGGTGDVLTGMIGGLLCQGYSPLDSATIGVYLHGLAGDRVAEKNGMVGLIASDLLEELPGIIKGFMDNGN